jgi:hypothetical protein
MKVFDAKLFTIRETVYQLREFLITYHERENCLIRKVFIFSDSVEEWDVWPQGPRLQGEDGGKAGARGSNKIIE